MSEPRPFGPLLATHPLVRDAKVCPICNRAFQVGEVPTLIPLGPDDAEEIEKAAQGRPYVAVCAPAHWDCWCKNGTV